MHSAGARSPTAVREARAAQREVCDRSVSRDVSRESACCVRDDAVRAPTAHISHNAMMNINDATIDDRSDGTNGTLNQDSTHMSCETTDIL